jgi:hypothetical protein
MQNGMQANGLTTNLINTFDNFSVNVETPNQECFYHPPSRYHSGVKPLVDR